jgi:hypothetical protein
MGAAEARGKRQGEAAKEEMRSYRTPDGPFAEGVFYEDKDIERICGDALREQELFPAKPEAIRIERFIEKRFGIYAEYEDMAEGVLGYTRFGAKGAEALYLSKKLADDPSKHAVRRLNATLAHEGGHMLLHGPFFALETLSTGSIFDKHPDFTRTRILCRDENKSRRPWWEVQANKCIPALLLPQTLVAIAVEPFLTTKGSLGMRSIPDDIRDQAARELAAIFEVNPQAVGFRLDALYPREGGQLTL